MTRTRAGEPAARFLVLVVALALPACAGRSAPPPAAMAPPPRDTASFAPRPGPEKPPAIEAPAPEDARPAAPESAPARPAFPAQPPTRHSLADRLASDVGGWLGEPSLVRREPPAEVWQYTAKGCVLDVFLYDRGGGLRVAHVESRTPRGADTDVDACLQAVLQRGPAPTS